MISNLHIKNIGIIEDISIDFNNGFNVLTGETGAGKTLIIDSLEIIAGGRFSKEMIRKGEDYSFVEVCLYLPNNNMQIDGNIIVSREIYTNGRNLCKINGRLVTVNELKSFMKNILDIHGQHDNQMLLDQSTHIKYLDNFAKEELSSIKEEYIILFNQFNEVKTDLKNNYGDDKEKQRKLDLLKYQLEEINQANLKLGEEVELENLRTKILNSEKVSENLSFVDNEINNNTVDSISNSIKALEKIENLDKEYEQQLNTLKSIYYDLQELARDITSLRENNDFEEDERKNVEERLDLIFSLKRKYGNNIEEIIEYSNQIKSEIEQIENLDEYIEKLKTKKELLESKMIVLCDKMHEIREKNAKILSQKIDKQLIDLEMKNATVKIKVEKNKEFNENGLDNIEILIKTNIGEEEKLLIKIASGGEMSRIMLAIKNVLANVDEVPILVFDEIDTGISGKAANSVAEKIKQISKKHQVLCVTHLAPIAAVGDYNYYISKEIIKEQTKTNIQLLDEENTIREIARISSGNINEITLEHARMLRKVG